MVDKVVPGTRVTVIGIHSLMSQGAKGAASGLGQPYIRVVGIQEDVLGGSRGAPVFSPEEIQSFRRVGEWALFAWHVFFTGETPPSFIRARGLVSRLARAW